jgi:hypothetical protein
MAPDRKTWHTLQRWLASKPVEIDIPYAPELAGAIPPVATRLRRDFQSLLGLVKAHALLHQASRDRSEEGHVIGTLDDYAVVRDLVAHIVSDGLGATVAPSVKQTVEAVAALLQQGAEEVTVAEVGQRLGGLDHSTAWRRVQLAISRGYLRNRETHRARTARLVLGDPLPDDLELLPSAERLQDCVVANALVPACSLPGRSRCWHGGHGLLLAA